MPPIDPTTIGYARDPRMDRAGLINPGEVAQRQLCALLRIEDLLAELVAQGRAGGAAPVVERAKPGPKPKATE